MRIRRFLYTFKTPLRLRAASRVSHRHKRPFLALLRLFIPLPTWHFPVPQPVSFKIMLNGIPLLMSRMASADLTNMRNVPIWRAKDTPLRSLYRIYEAMVAREYYAVGREVEYCWCQNVVAGSPAPSRPVRRGSRSVLSPCLYRRRPRQGVNRRLGLGMRRDRNKHVYRKMIDEEFPLFTPETPPFWTRTVPAFGVELTAGLPGVSFGFVG